MTLIKYSLKQNDMPQTATTVPPKGLGSIHLSDFWKGLLLAALTNVLLSLYAIINTGAWPTHQDWIEMGRATLAIIIAYLLKNFGTNNVGEILQKDKPVVHVDATDLKELQEKAGE